MDVLLRSNLNPVLRLSFDLFLHLRRGTGSQDVIGNLDVLADDAAGRDERSLANNAAVEQHRVAADEGVALDVTIFHHRSVADGDVVVDPRQVRHVNDRIILNRRSRADANRPVVAPKHRSEPDARLLPDLDVADEYGGRRDERRGVDLGRLAAVTDDHVWKAYAMHRHNTPLRGVKATPRPAPGNPNYSEVHYRYAGVVGHIHEVVEIDGRQLAKVGFNDRKIVYYFLDDLELDQSAKRGTFHDQE
jgi:hypothetical protein